MRTLTCFSLGLAALLFLIGCGGSGTAKDYKFHSGQGKVEGPFPENGLIHFFCETDGNFTARAPIEPGGAFNLTTYVNQPSRTVSGFPEGTYRVEINVPNSTKTVPLAKLPHKLTVKQNDPPLVIKIKA